MTASRADSRAVAIFWLNDGLIRDFDVTPLRVGTPPDGGRQ